MGEKTPEQIHEETEKLREYRLEFLFRNEEFTKLVEDFCVGWEDYRSLVKKHRALSNEYGLGSQLTLQVDETDQPKLKKVKIARNNMQRELDLKEDRLCEFLGGMNIHIHKNHVHPRLVPDYFKKLFRRGVIDKYPESPILGRGKNRKGYILNAISQGSVSMADGVYALHERRILVKSKFEDITGYKLERRAYEADFFHQAQIDYTREVFPVIMQNLENYRGKNCHGTVNARTDGFFGYQGIQRKAKLRFTKRDFRHGLEYTAVSRENFTMSFVDGTKSTQTGFSLQLT